MEPRCAAHPDRPAAGTCERCGAFACAEEYASVAGRWLCGACAARPDADYLAAFRDRYWGKRDFWGWLMGTGAVARVPDAISIVAAGQWGLLPLTVALAAAQVCYFLGLRWARGLIFVPAAAVTLRPLFVAFTRPEPLGMGTVSVMLATGFSGLVGSMVVGLLVLFSTRNQLFFRVEISRERLKRAWDLYNNNLAARAGFACSLGGVLIPGLGLLGLVLSIIGLRRVDPGAFPPIGRKRQAVAGIVLGALDTAGWGVFFTFLWFSTP